MDPMAADRGGTEYTVVIGVFTLAAFVVIAFFAWLEGRRERERLTTVRAYLERGVAPPEELVRTLATTRATRIRRGLVTVAVGGALMAIFALGRGIEGAWALGLLPVAVGLAQLLGAVLTSNRS